MKRSHALPFQGGKRKRHPCESLQPHTRDCLDRQSRGATAAPCNNAEVIRQWWQSKDSGQTQKAYQKDAQRFLACVGERPLNDISLDDLKDYQRALAEKGLRLASIARRLSAIKSLLTFGSTLFPAFFPVNVGAAFKIKSGKDTLAERILPEEAVLALLALQRRANDDPFRDRNTVLLRQLYKAALRREEVCRRSWGDVQDRENGQGQITVMARAAIRGRS